MSFMKAPRPAERTLIDGATLADIKRASKTLRDAVPNSALADLVDRKVKAIESPKELRRAGERPQDACRPSPAAELRAASNRAGSA